jgi:hypothetical protein
LERETEEALEELDPDPDADAGADSKDAIDAAIEGVGEIDTGTGTLGGTTVEGTTAVGTTVEGTTVVAGVLLINGGCGGLVVTADIGVNAATERDTWTGTGAGGGTDATERGTERL